MSYSVSKTVILEYIENKTLKSKKLYQKIDVMNLLPHETLLEKKNDYIMTKELLICKNNMWFCKKYREVYEPLVNEQHRGNISQIYVKSEVL